MRRWWTLLLAGVTGVLLSGCGLPAGVDGELTDGWAALGAPRIFVPPAGVCHAGGFVAIPYLSSFSPVECTTSHRLETVHVGTFTGLDAERTEPPEPGSAQLRGAFAECDGRASEYVGGPWRTARLWLGVAVPPAEAWHGGARWFRCDLSEVANVENNGDPVNREASLAGALRSASPLHLGCYAAKLTRAETIESMPASDCARPHNAEFTGVWTAPDIAYPVTDRDWVPFYAGCWQQVARYVGVPDDGNLRYRTGIMALPAAPNQWRTGDRGVRCYLWLSDRSLTASLKGAGPAALPIKTG